MNDVSSRELFMYLEGEVTRRRASEIEEHLSGCRACNENLQESQQMIEKLADPDEDLAGLDLVADVRKLIEEKGSRAEKPRARMWALSACITVLLGLSAVLIFWLSGEEPGEFRVKSAGSAMEEQDRWVGLKVFRLDARGRPEPLADRLGAKDFLLFAYDNQGHSPLSYLMVLAVDSTKRVYWFYPAYTSKRLDPESILIGRNVFGAELFEKIRHEFQPGPMVIYGLFTRTPLRVSEVEALLEGLGLGERIPLKDSAQHILETTVEP